MATESFAPADLKTAVRRGVDARREDIVGIAQAIAAQPELGFKEVRTAALVADRMKSMGLSPETGLGMTGVKAVLQGGAGDGPTVAVLGELDSVLCWEHPDHDPQTGAVHACGHSGQVAEMLG